MLDVLERIEEREKRELQKRENIGRKEGRKEEKLATAKRMKEDKYNIEQIVKITQLQKEELENL